jgi:hypothetical protein
MKIKNCQYGVAARLMLLEVNGVFPLMYLLHERAELCLLSILNIISAKGVPKKDARK